MVSGSPGRRPPYETALMMWPDPRSVMCGKKLVTVLTGPSRFVSSIQLQSWLDILSSLPWRRTPAALTRMSTRPIALMESRTRDLTDASLRTSVDRAIADSLVPSLRTSSTVFSIRGTSKSATTTLAPWRASALAIALPTPLPPPVTTATLVPRAPRAGGVASGKSSGTANTMHCRRANPVQLEDGRQPDERNLAVGPLLAIAVVGKPGHDSPPGFDAGLVCGGVFPLQVTEAGRVAATTTAPAPRRPTPPTSPTRSRAGLARPAGPGSHDPGPSRCRQAEL